MNLSFDSLASGYDPFMLFWGLRRPGEIVAAVGRGQRLLDLMGGTGALALKIKRAFAEVLVADASPAMLARAAARGLATLNCDALDIPLADGWADCILLSDALHHVPDPLPLLSESYRVLKPGGRLVVRDFNAAFALCRFFSFIEGLCLGASPYLRAGAADDLVRARGFERERFTLRGMSYLGVWRKP